ncbi:unnamed protein product, partial [Symbiodinium microadriaticum]
MVEQEAIGLLQQLARDFNVRDPRWQGNEFRELEGALSEVVHRQKDNASKFQHNKLHGRMEGNDLILPRLKSLISNLDGYVLDRFHRGNCTACIEQYAALANVSTSNNEQFNNWLSNFQHTLRHMRFETMERNLLLIGNLWNAEVVLHRAPTAFASSARSRAPTAPFLCTFFDLVPAILAVETQ